MGSRFQRFVVFTISLFCATSALAVDLTVGDLTLVSKQRIGRTTYNFTYKANVTNTGRAVQDVSATVTSTSPNTTIVESGLIFGDVPAGATVTSTDTFTIRHNRRFAFDPSALVFDIVSTPLDDIPPKILSVFPGDGAQVTQNPSSVSGQIDDPTATVVVNGIVAMVTSSGYFSAFGIQLQDGLNTINVSATDPAGNVGTADTEVRLVDFIVASSIFTDNDDTYTTGQMVRVDIQPPPGLNEAQIVSGVVRITSASQGYDSGPIGVLFGSIFALWDTTDLNPSVDYIASVELTDSSGQIWTNDVLAIELTSNPPVISRLIQSVDLRVSAIGPQVEFVRTYILGGGSDVPFSPGWTHSYFMRIVDFPGTAPPNFVPGYAKVFNVDGSGSYFRENGDGTYTSPKADFRTLTKAADGTFDLREKDGTIFRFDSVSDDKKNKLMSIQDRVGNVLALSYVSSRLMTLTDASGQVTTITYGCCGPLKIASITDHLGRSVTYGYDAQRNLTSVTDIGGQTTTYAYDAQGNLTSVTDPAGRQTAFSIDAEGRLASISKAGGVETTSFAYGTPAENQVTITDVLGNQNVLTHNNNGSVIKIADALGNVTRLSYDASQNLTDLTDANGQITMFTYDAVGNMLGLTNGAGNLRTFTYDPLFNQWTNLTDEKGNVTRFSYDAKGNLTTITYPDSSTETFTYDSIGNQLSKTDRKGQIVSFTYDAKGNQTRKTFPDSTVNSFTYDSVGNMLTAVDASGTITHVYDASDRLSQVSSPGGEVVSYAYDAAGNRTALTYPDGSVLNYEYDAAGRLTTIKRSGVVIASYTYDQLSRPTRRVLANGTSSTFSYDASGQLLDLVNRKSDSSIISSYSHTYDNVGNRLTLNTLLGLTQYSYDAINQLVNVTLPGGLSATYNFDAAGNRSTLDEDGNVTSYTVNDVNEYSNVGGDTYTYDANGSLSSKTTTNGSTSYAYDFENRLIAFTTPTETVSFAYDPLGRRISKTSNAGQTNYIHDDLEVIMEKDGTGSVLAKYVYGSLLDEVLLMERGGAEYFYSQDGLGSVTELSDGSENIVESISYDVYGSPSSSSAIGNPYFFTGREYDPETGLVYFRARYYDPLPGRFLTLDPVGIADAGAGRNLYSYVGNNPVNFVDPLGLRRESTGQRRKRCRANPGQALCPPPQSEESRKFDEFVCGQVFGKLGSFLGGRVGGTVGGSFGDYFCGQIYSGDPTFIQPDKGNQEHGGSDNEVAGRLKCDQESDLCARIHVPYRNALVRADVPVFGNAFGRSFKSYKVQYGAGKAPEEWITIGEFSEPQSEPVTAADLDDSHDLSIHGNLATWDTGLTNYVYLPSHPKDHPIDLNGTYTLRLVVTGHDGSTAEDRVTVNVANAIPNAWGGVVRSKDSKAVLSVPAQAIMEPFRLISIQPTTNNDLPTVSAAGTLVSSIYEVREPGERFTKEVLLGVAYAGTVVADPARIGIYGYNTESKEWEYLSSTRRDGEDVVYTKLRQLHSYYALISSTSIAEGSVLKQKPSADTGFLKANVANSGHYLIRNTFEDNLGQWSNRDNEVGAEVILDEAATFDGSRALKITNSDVGGNYAVNVVTSPFDVRDYPLVQFDYRVSADVETNFLVKVGGRWYDIGFTDSAKEFVGKRVNIAHIGDIGGIVADDRWHTAHFNLYEMLRTMTGNTVVEQMIMADWDIGGYMKLQFGRNRQGATYYVDNFAVTREVMAGLMPEGGRVLVDDFNQKKESNTLGGLSSTFTDGIASQIDASFVESDSGGHSLSLVYDVEKRGGFAGYISSLKNLDLRGFQTLTLRVRAEGSGQDLMIGLKDSKGYEDKVRVSDYLPGKLASGWQTAEVPLVAFSDIVDLGRIDSINLSFKNDLNSQGTVLVDDVAFHREISTFLVDDFERGNQQLNALGREHYTFASGAVAINGLHTHNSPNGIYRISYGGNIGDIKAYASELFSYGEWTTELGGINCSKCGVVSFRIRGAKGGEQPNIYVDDGSFKWGVDLEDYVEVTTEWQEVSIPLQAFAGYGVDITHMAALQVVFEWEKMSGSIYLDDIRFGKGE